MGAAEATSAPPKTEHDAEFLELPIDQIGAVGNIRELDDRGVAELAGSIKEQGVLEPVLVVRAKEPRAGGTHPFQLVAGFRRRAAAVKAGLRMIPARIVDLTDAEVTEARLAENLQREDLTELEEARAFRAYVDAGHTMEQLATRIGKSRPYVSNRVRLLGLPDPVQKLVAEGKLSPSHAETLASLPKEAAPVIVQVARDVVEDGGTVRELEHKVSWALRQHKEQLAWKEKLAKAKFPNCPTCNKAATQEDSYGGTVSHGDWQQVHRWSLSTGKTEAQVRLERMKSDRRARNSTPTPTRDLSQPATSRAAPHPHAIALRMLEQLGPAGIAEVRLSDGTWGGRENPSITLVLSEDAARRAKLPIRGDEGLRLIPAKYRSGELTQVTALQRYGFDARERKAGLAEFDTWARGSIRAGKLAKVSGLKADAKLLEGNVSEVLTRLEKTKGLAVDLELLEDLRRLESNGKNRPSILERIDDWLDVEGEV